MADKSTDLATDILAYIDQSNIDVIKWRAERGGEEYPAEVALRDVFKFIRNHPEGKNSGYEARRFVEELKDAGVDPLPTAPLGGINQDTARVLDIIARAAATDFVTIADIHSLEEMGIAVTEKMVNLGYGNDRATILEAVGRGEVHMVMFPSVVAAAVRDMVD